MFSSKLTHQCIFCHVTLHQATSDITGGCRGNVTPPTPHVESQGKVPGDVTHSVHYLGSNLHRTKLLTLFPQWIFLRLLLGKIFLVHLVPNVVVGLCVRTGVCSVFLTYLCSSVEHVHCPAAACSSSPWMIIYDKRRSLDFLQLTCSPRDRSWFLPRAWFWNSCRERELASLPARAPKLLQKTDMPTLYKRMRYHRGTVNTHVR